MRNIDILTADVDRIAELLYQADSCDEFCQLVYDENQDEYTGCRYENEDQGKGCLKCIKEWLLKEDN
jgi:hypothetical protein